MSYETKVNGKGKSDYIRKLFGTMTCEGVVPQDSLTMQPDSSRKGPDPKLCCGYCRFSLSCPVADKAMREAVVNK